VGRTIAFTHYGPLDCLLFDLVGPFPTSKGKNCYWLTMIDRYTRAVELVAVESKESKVVAKAIFENWISRYGAPLVMLSDDEFRNNILKEVCKLTKTKQIHTAPYRPSTNGLCERVHSFAINMLQNATDGNIRNWDTHLPAIRFAIMTSYLDGFGFSPYQLLFGRRPRLPIDLQIPYDTNVSKDVREYFNINMEAIRSIRETFDYTQSKVDARMRYRRDLSQRRRPSEFQVGDLVYHTREYYGQDPVQRGLAKLLGKFEGPSLITKRLGENTY
jgi:transposase InsO family protein